MRNGQNKRMRGRNRKSHNPLSRVYESNGPDVKIRGTASHIAEKYVQLARDAQSSSDPVAAENYFQHAEHYFRLIAAAQEQFRQTTPFYRGEGGMDLQDDAGDDLDEDGNAQPGLGEQPSFGTRDPQPYLPRDAQFYAPREQPYVRDQQNVRENVRDQQNVRRMFATSKMCVRMFATSKMCASTRPHASSRILVAATRRASHRATMPRAMSSGCRPSSPAPVPVPVPVPHRLRQPRRRITKLMARTALKARPIAFRCTGAAGAIADRGATSHRAEPE